MQAFGRGTGFSAAVLGLLVVLVGFSAAAVALLGDAAFVGLVDRLYLFSGLVALSGVALACLVRGHDPSNRIATIALAVAWGFAAALVLDRYTLLGYEHGWPGTRWTLWGAQWCWVPALLAVPTLLTLRFPDGRLPTRGARALEVWVLGSLVVATVGFALTPYGELDAGPRVPLTNPVAVDGAAAVFTLGMVGTGLGAVGCLAAYVVRMRRSRGVQRTQLQWGVAGMGAAVVLIATSAAVGGDAAWLALVGVAALPAAIGVAVVRHGLFDVGWVLNRSLVYGSLTAVILAVYVVAVGLLGDVLGRTVGAPLVATGLVALGIEPLRHGTQRLANRIVYGQRDDPYAVLARLGERLAAPAERERVLDGITAAVTRALRLRGAAVVVGGRTIAATGDTQPPVLEVPLAGAGDGDALRVATHPGHHLSRRDRQLLGDLGHQVAAAVQAARLRAEVETARVRMVVAREEERHRIRQDLHDGLGPTLAAIALEVERAGLDVTEDPGAAGARLEEVAARVREAVRGVRGLVEGLSPTRLDHLGLSAAVHELARDLGQGTVTVEVSTQGDLDDLPAAVALAAYRIVGEALTNVLRHARASTCGIRLERDGRALLVLVRDDGVGIGETAGAATSGLGIRSMRARAAELAGSLRVEHGPGTTVRAELPLEVP